MNNIIKIINNKVIIRCKPSEFEKELIISVLIGDDEINNEINDDEINDEIYDDDELNSMDIELELEIESLSIRLDRVNAGLSNNKYDEMIALIENEIEKKRSYWNEMIEQEKYYEDMKALIEEEINNK